MLQKKAFVTVKVKYCFFCRNIFVHIFYGKQFFKKKFDKNWILFYGFRGKNQIKKAEALFNVINFNEYFLRLENI